MVGSGGLTFGGHSYSQREVLCHGLQVPAAEAHANHLISRPATKRLSATGCHWQAIARGPQIAGLGWSCSKSSHVGMHTLNCYATRCSLRRRR